MSDDQPTEKRCGACGETKPIEGFCRNRRRKDGRAWWCRECAKASRQKNRDKNKVYQQRYNSSPKGKERRRRYEREWRARPGNNERRLAAHRERRRHLLETHPNAIKLRQVKSGPCVDCGRTYPPEVMDLDHVRGTKSFRINIQEVVRPYVTEEILEAELAKCEVRCPTCHRLRHFLTRTQGRPSNA